MAKANHKTRPAADEEPIAFQVPLQSSLQLPSESNKPFVPWMQVTDALLGHLGFMPGERVHFSVDYIKGTSSSGKRSTNHQHEGPRLRPFAPPGVRLVVVSSES